MPPSNPIYNNLTSTYIYNATITPRPDFAANFTYPFAPNIAVQKTVNPSSGPLGTTHNVVVVIQNFDNVTVTNLNVTDYEAPSSYKKTLQISPSGVQAGQFPNFPPGQTQSFSYAATTKKQWNVRSIPRDHRVHLASTKRDTDPIHGYHRQAPDLVIKRPWTQFTRTFTDLQPYSYLSFSRY